MGKFNEWGLVFRECHVCGKVFVAENNYYKLCSDECRKEQAVIAKKKHDEEAKYDKARLQYENAYQHWSNRLRKLKNGKNADLEKAATFKSAFDVFRKNAKKYRDKIKSRKMTFSEFTSWLATQKNEADNLMDTLLPPNN